MTAGAHRDVTGTTEITLAGIGRGARMAAAFGAGSVMYGLAFGVLAGQTGLSAAEAVIMSVLVFSGTAQVAVLQNWSAAPQMVALFVTVLVVNSRYLLMGAALRPWLGRLGAVRASLSLLPLVDGAFALAMREHERGERDAGLLVGAALLSYVAWVAATGLGFMVGWLTPDPRMIGLDFVVVAFCASSTVMMAERVRDWWPAGVAVAVIALVDRLAPGPWVVVAAGLVAAVVGALRYRPGSGSA